MAVGNFELARRVSSLPGSVSCSERLLLHTLLLHRNAQTGECFPNCQTLAREMNVSLRTVKATVKRLAVAGLLTVGKRKTRHGDGNTYALNLPAIGATIAPIDGGGEGATVAPFAAGDGCNPRPQRVQSTPAIGATIAPEQIRNRESTTTTTVRALQLQPHTRTGARGAVAVDDSPKRSTILKDLLDAEKSPEGKRRILALDGDMRRREALMDAVLETGIPGQFMLDTMGQWEDNGWKTSGGIPVTAKNAKSLLLAWWENCDTQQYYIDMESEALPG